MLTDTGSSNSDTDGLTVATVRSAVPGCVAPVVPSTAMANKLAHIFLAGGRPLLALGTYRNYPLAAAALVATTPSAAPPLVDPGVVR